MNDQRTQYIVFGASGDLSKRYLLPALKNINVDVIPISRKDYPNINNLINDREDKIFHLAIPYEGVAEAVELIANNFDKRNTKILLEKPFGKDLDSAQKLAEHVHTYFREDQIYHVDHYLAKQSLQNIASGELDTNNLKSIEVVASEKIGIEGRAHFYEQTGALRDFIQSHVLEMTAITLAQSFKPQARSKALEMLAIVCDIEKHECVKRGQYEGYREEVGNPKSMVETFVFINMVSNDPVWKGVPIILATGKALDKKLTQIRIKYESGEKIFSIDPEPDAYERVIKGAIEGNSDLFMSSNEVLETWRILDSIQKSWEQSEDDLIIYPKGSSIYAI